VNVIKHLFYVRVGKDIETEVPITLIEALKGAKMTVQTVDGPVTIMTKPGVCTGDTFRLKHFGAPEFNPPDAYDP
jgi:DnaJ-class molecular chaperone